MIGRAKVLTVSDSVSRGAAEVRAGSALEQRLIAADLEVVERRVVSDGLQPVSDALNELARGFTGVIVSTGGTGFGPRDFTPEATRAMIEREAPGLAEAMRFANPLGRLSRSVAGTIGDALVVNTPGSPTGAVECLEAILDVLPHILELLAGQNPHRHPDGH